MENESDQQGQQTNWMHFSPTQVAIACVSAAIFLLVLLIVVRVYLQ